MSWEVGMERDEGLPFEKGPMALMDGCEDGKGKGGKGWLGMSCQLSDCQDHEFDSMPQERDEYSSIVVVPCGFWTVHIKRLVDQDAFPLTNRYTNVC